MSSKASPKFGDVLLRSCGGWEGCLEVESTFLLTSSGWRGVFVVSAVRLPTGSIAESTEGTAVARSEGAVFTVGTVTQMPAAAITGVEGGGIGGAGLILCERSLRGAVMSTSG
jgi:hypothetical protein